MDSVTSAQRISQFAKPDMFGAVTCQEEIVTDVACSIERAEQQIEPLLSHMPADRQNIGSGMRVRSDSLEILEADPIKDDATKLVRPLTGVHKTGSLVQRLPTAGGDDIRGKERTAHEIARETG